VPLAGLILLVGWALLAKLTKVASIASMAAVVATIPLALWQGVRGIALVWLALTIALVVWRHRSNIARMIRGSEQKVTV
jgi:glycerol-3-phosphate acyltransferase PlsY